MEVWGEFFHPIVYHQYCSSSYLVIRTDSCLIYRSWQWKSSSNLIPARLSEQQSQLWLPMDLDESTLTLSLPMQSLWLSSSRFSTAPTFLWPRKILPSHLRVIYLLFSSKHGVESNYSTTSLTFSRKSTGSS